MCGIIVTHSLHDAYSGLKALQHRGQEAAGIAVKRPNGSIDAVKWTGLVTDFSLVDLYTLLGGDGIYIGHIRYSTSGNKKDPRNAHPHYIGGKEDVFPRHVIARNVDIAGVHNGTLVNHKELGDEDCDTLTLLRIANDEGIGALFKKVPAAYSAAIISKKSDGVAVMRDAYGMRPLWLGWKDGKWVAASEDCAIVEIGGKPHREVKPGELELIIAGERVKNQLGVRDRKYCFFELNYLANLESSFGGQIVRNVRRRLGQYLVQEIPSNIVCKIDVVTYIPHAPEPAVRGFADEIHKPMAQLLYKIREERSFMQPEQRSREDSIDGTLYVRDNINLKDKTVMVIDDSIVRGTVIKVAAKKLKQAGVSNVYWGSCTPPIGEINGDVKHGCSYGVDMPPTCNDFVARKYNLRTEEGKAKFASDVSLEGIFYISEAGMFKAIKADPSEYCTFCIGGPNPIKTA